MLKLLLPLLVVACSSSSPALKVEDGERLFAEKGCGACHSVDGTPRIGPTLQAAFGRRVQVGGQDVVFDEPYFVESVMAPDAKIVDGYPRGVQPSFEGHLTDAELAAIGDYVKTL